MTVPACGNNPHHQMSDGDRRVVESFRAYLAARGALLEAADWYVQQGKTVLAAAQVATDLRRRAGAEARHVGAGATVTETDEQRADREETERDHARGDHTHCGLMCEVEMPTERLRNFVIAKGYPGTKGALAELERRAAGKAAPNVDLPARLLACGFCYEEQGEEVHPHPECPVGRVALRDHVAAALYERERPPRDPHWPKALPADREVFEAMADAVLPAVLSATTNHDTDDVAARTLASLERVTDRARRAEAEVKRLRTMYNASEARVNDLIDERDQLLETRTDRAVVLREAADEIAGIDFHPNARARSLDIAAGLARRLRRMADETAATETVPCTRPEPHPAHSHSGLRKGVAVHGRCPGQPAAGARQDGAQR